MSIRSSSNSSPCRRIRASREVINRASTFVNAQLELITRLGRTRYCLTAAKTISLEKYAQKPLDLSKSSYRTGFNKLFKPITGNFKQALLFNNYLVPLLAPFYKGSSFQFRGFCNRCRCLRLNPLLNS